MQLHKSRLQGTDVRGSRSSTGPVAWFAFPMGPCTQYLGTLGLGNSTYGAGKHMIIEYLDP